MISYDTNRALQLMHSLYDDLLEDYHIADEQLMLADRAGDEGTRLFYSGQLTANHIARNRISFVLAELGGSVAGRRRSGLKRR
jgi:hypothetical protein